MLDSLVKSIKSERKLSMSHWRFRLLHWAFGVNPKTPSQSPLPNYFYTHYCPLFHLTNLILIASPLIFAMKVLFVFMKLSAKGAICCAALCDRFYQKIPKRKRRVSQPRQLTEAEKRKEDVASIKDILIHNRRRYRTEADFEGLWLTFSPQFLVINQEEAREVYNKLVTRLNEAEDKAKLKAERRKQNILFWVNFSRVFFKFGLNIAYVVFGAAFLYLLVKLGIYGIPMAFSVASFIAANFVTILAIVTSIVLVVLGVFTAVYLVVLAEGKYQIRDSVSVPAKAVSDGVVAGATYVQDTFSGFFEFISIFYEENCPPVVIVDETEAEIAAEIEE